MCWILSFIIFLLNACKQNVDSRSSCNEISIFSSKSHSRALNSCFFVDAMTTINWRHAIFFFLLFSNLWVVVHAELARHESKHRNWCMQTTHLGHQSEPPAMHRIIVLSVCEKQLSENSDGHHRIRFQCVATDITTMELFSKSKNK